MKQAYLGLGSNIGDRYLMLKRAIKFLENDSYITIRKYSSIYETEPEGYKEQPKFLNMVIEISTSYKPLELLAVINKVEQLLNRKRDFRWGPRTIDIDILLYEKEIISEDSLKIPHPYISKRLFVLVPLSEIYIGEIPGESYSIEHLIEFQKKDLIFINKYNEQL